MVVAALSATSAATPAEASGATVALPSPDSASPESVTIQDKSCNAGDLCFWVNTGQGGAKGHLSGTNSAWGNFSQSQCTSGTWDNCASSIINNGQSCTARVWADGNYRGEHLDILRGHGYINLTSHYITWPVRSWNDEISSSALWAGVRNALSVQNTRFHSKENFDDAQFSAMEN